MRKKSTDGYILKSDVLKLIQGNIRNIQMLDYGSDNGIPQLYSVMYQIERMKVRELEPLRSYSSLRKDYK